MKRGEGLSIRTAVSTRVSKTRGIVGRKDTKCIYKRKAQSHFRERVKTTRSNHKNRKTGKVKSGEQVATVRKGTDKGKKCMFKSKFSVADP
jgi:hypothetical protein